MAQTDCGLTYPARVPCKVPRLSLAEVGKMTFYPPDDKAFPAMNLARQAASRKGNAGAVLNGANEAPVGLFLSDKLPFWRIPELVAQTMERIPFVNDPTLDDILTSDREAREAVLSLVGAE